MKKNKSDIWVYVIICLVVIFIGISAYFDLFDTPKSNPEGYDVGWEVGFNDCEEFTFSLLYNASYSNKKTLLYGEAWETKDFSLSLKDYTNTDGQFLDCRLSLNNMTIVEGDKNDNIYIGIYSYNYGWDEIISGFDHYCLYALLDEGYSSESYTSKATFGLNDHPKYIAVIIVMNGNIYNGVYRLNEN